jgi:hypothetical protein
MKKLTTLLIALSLALATHAYTWNPIGPDTANISTICFGVGLPYWVLCADDGMYLYNYSTHECDYYTYGLPVKGAAWFTFDKMLLVMGDGSWSDGIWTFDFETHQFEVVEWNANPNFLFFDDFNDTWWAGFQFGGMMISNNGIDWEPVPYFENNSPVCMDYYGDHLVVSAVSNIYGVYYSDDGGEIWQESPGAPVITDMDFDGWGKLLGVFPEYSNSSGLWLSENFGQSWEVMFWADNMSAVGFDAAGEIFVGWKEELGIARYDPEAQPPGLTYLNEGLSSLNINRIQINPTMSAMAIFVSTDEGAYYSYDYMVGVEEPGFMNNIQIEAYPNPAKDKLMLKSEYEIELIRVFNASSKQILEQVCGTKQSCIDISSFSTGIYFIEVNARFGKEIQKILIQ